MARLAVASYGQSGAGINLDSVKISANLDSVKFPLNNSPMTASRTVPPGRGKAASTQPYHHGDLRATLLREATALLRSEGIEGLSLRKLAERAGVSRTAPYHHFADKNALLCALAAEGFAELEALIAEAAAGGELRAFVRRYLSFASDNPELYELMFGRSIWKAGAPEPELKDIAYRSFRRYSDYIAALTAGAKLPPGSQPLRLAQASWATLHGLCRLLIDGIYLDRADMEAVSDEAVRVLAAALRSQDGG